MKIIKQNKIVIFLFLLTILKLILCCKLPNFYIETYGYDDKLMLDMTNSISNGNWLGKYSDITLVKGFFFPLLISLFRFLNISSQFGLSLIYVIACFTFCFVTRNIFKNKNYCYILYIFLLLNPISFSSETYQRMYRYVLGPSQMLFLISFLYGIYKNENIKIILPHLIGLGLTCTSIIFTREDYIFMIVLLIICFIVYIKKLKKNSYILLIPIIIIFIFKFIVININNHYYKANLINELTNYSFKKAYTSILKIKPDKEIYRVSIPKSTIEKLYEVSPTFRNLKSIFDKKYENNIELEDGEIIDGYMIWIVRRIASIKNYYNDFNTSEDFWNKVDKEINIAFKENKLKQRFIISSVYFSPPTKTNIKKFIINIPKTLKYIYTYDEVKTFDYIDLKTSKVINITESINEKTNDLYYSIYINNINSSFNTANIGTLSYTGIGGIFNVITFIYKYLSMIINLFGIICFIKLFKKKDLFLNIILFLSMVILICGIAYTDASSFKAIRYFYLAPVYILFISFSLISIFMYLEEFYGTNNIVSLFKRRSKHRKLYKKSI